MADGISGPLIIHSPRDPLKRSIDFDQEVVLMLTDWYHKYASSTRNYFSRYSESNLTVGIFSTSSEIVEHMLTEPGYEGTPAAPGANSALINGVGQWNCSYASKAQQCTPVESPVEFTFQAGERLRFRLVNAGAHSMFFYSVDEHKLNVTEADATPVYGR